MPDDRYVTTAVLQAIRSRDPDGGAVEPTAADYAAFQEWAVRTYGRTAWTVYLWDHWDN
jgi:hypothetical protein